MKKIIAVFIFFVILVSSIYTTYATKDNSAYKNTITVVHKNLETQEETIETITLDDLNCSSTETYIPDNTDNLISPNVIIGDDDRSKTDTNTFPYSAVCCVKAYYGSNSNYSIGTGILVDDNVVVTAAHCVKGASKVEIIPGYQDGNAPYGSTTAMFWNIPGKYYDYEKENNDMKYAYDWAILGLNDKIGAKTGWLGIEYKDNDANLIEMNVWNAGYPYDKNTILGTPRQYMSVGKVTEVHGLVFTFSNDTMKGNSGGPIVDNSNNHVIGVVCAENETSGYNMAVRITETVFATICRYIERE